MPKKYRAGFDVGGTNARVTIFDDQLQPLSCERRRIRDATALDDVVATLIALLDDASRQVGADLEDITDIEAIGFGLAGQLSVDGRTVQNAPNLGWRDVNFVDTFESALKSALSIDKVPTTRIINDLNAQLWGEYIDGAVADIDDVLAVFVGTGIGGAILSKGRLVTGADANAGEIGHSKVVVGGRPCGCGEKGCVEAYAGGVHLERQIAAMARNTNDEAINPLVTDGHVDLGAADELALQHHGVGDIWEEATDFLAVVVANAITLLNPRALLIGGGVLDNCHNFRSMFLQKTIPIVLEVARTNLVVEQASLGDLSGMLGAADLAQP